MKKMLDPTGIVNELKGSSLFFAPGADSPAPVPGESRLEPASFGEANRTPNEAQPPRPEGPSEKEESTPVRPFGDPTGESPESPPARPPVRVRRTITRYSFEFFQDQVEALKKLALEEQLAGEKGSMSRMVRDAIDRYLAARARTEA